MTHLSIVPSPVSLGVKAPQADRWGTCSVLSKRASTCAGVSRRAPGCGHLAASQAHAASSTQVLGTAPSGPAGKLWALLQVLSRPCVLVISFLVFRTWGKPLACVSPSTTLLLEIVSLSAPACQSSASNSPHPTADGLESPMKSVASKGNWVLNTDHCEKPVHPSLGDSREKVKPAFFFRGVVYF